MKDDDMHRGGEIGELARLLSVPPERDLPAGREQTLKEHLMSEFRTHGGSTRTHGSARMHGGSVRASAGAGEPARRRRRRTALAAAAGAGVLAVTAVTISVTSRAGHPAAARPTTTGAAVLLAKIADAAARQPVPAVRDDQYMYLRQKIASEVISVGNDKRPKAVMERPVITQVWLSVSDLCRPGLAIDQGGRTPLDEPKGARCPNPGGLNDPTYRFMQTLPTDPRALLDLIYTTEKGHGQSPDQEAFTTIGDMLGGSIAPPQVTAALYRTAALIPGVTVVPRAVDAVGRPGVAVAFTWRGTRTEWIFDSKTLTLLGRLDVSTATGNVIGETAFLQRAIVDHLGQVPHDG
jgi:hypothetical protein